MAVFCVKMFERLLYGLLLLNLALRQATGVFDSCRSTDRVQLPSTPPPQCGQLETLCHTVQNAEYLVGTEVSYECPLSGTITFTKHTGSVPRTQITNGGRFSINGQTLTITNIQPEDEGLYRCSKDNNGAHNLGCLAVSGLARFMTCESNFSFEYTLVPTTENSCSQNVNVTEGEDAELDTRLLFDEGGDCQCIEEVTLLRVKKDSAESNPRFFCNERNGNCSDKEEFVVRGASGLPYDFSYVLKSVDMSNSGRYYVEVEVMQPRVSSTRRFWKIINVTVNPRPDTVSPTTEEPTTDNGTSIPTPTTMNQTPSVVGLDPIPQTTIAVGVAVAVVVVIAAIVVVVVVVISRRPGSRDVEDTHQHDKAGTGEEVVYATIEETGQRHSLRSKNKPDPTYGFSGIHHHLHPKLESKMAVL